MHSADTAISTGNLTLFCIVYEEGNFRVAGNPGVGLAPHMICALQYARET